MNESQICQRPASLVRALKKGFRAAYDHLGYVVLVSFVSLLGTVALTSLAWKAAAEIRLGALGTLLFLPAAFFYYLCAVGVFYFAERAVCHESPSVADTWTGVRTLFWPSLWLFAINLVVGVVLIGDAVFFLSIKSRAIGIVVAVVCLYLAAAWLMSAMYHLPLLSAQIRMESGPRPLVIIRKSFLLALGSPGFTLGLAFAIIALAVLCVLPAGLGMAMFFLGTSAFLLTHGLRELFVRYGVVEDEPEVVQDTGWPKG